MAKERRKGKRSGEGSGFLSGVFILSASTVIVKVIGLACKIPLLSVLGAEGMGYFNSAYEIYALLCVLSTAGLPVAMSMLVSASKERGDGHGIGRIYRVSLALFLSIGTLGSLGMLLFARQISRAIGNPDAMLCILAIAPALLSVCFASAVRGYFQGFGNMKPTAVSQIIEAVGKLSLGVLFAVIAVKRGASVAEASAFAVFGLTLGTFLSAFYLLILKLRDRRNIAAEAKQPSAKHSNTLSTLIKIAFPITLGSAVISASRMVDMALILRRLTDIGISAAQANEIYGSYTTLALPIFSLVPSLITPVALSLVPQLSGAIERGSLGLQKKITSDSLRLTALLGIPSSMGIALYAHPILSLLFSSEREAVDVASPLLAVLGASVLFSCVITVTNAILQSYRRTYLPIASMAIGTLVKLVSAYILMGNESIGVMGAPISTFLCNIVITVINLAFVMRVQGDFRGMLSLWGKPFIASVGGILLSVAVYIPIYSLAESEKTAFFAALFSAAAGFALFAALTGAVTREDIEMIPVLNRFNKKTEKKKTKGKDAENERKYDG